MKKFFTFSVSLTSFAIFVMGLYFLANIEPFLAIGFGILLLIHELGHVLALKKLGTSFVVTIIPAIIKTINNIA